MHIAATPRRQPLSAGTSQLAPLSAVIDRPDRQMSLWLRLRNYVGRNRFKGSLLRSITELATTWIAAKRADIGERWASRARITQILPGADTLEHAASVAIYVHYAPEPAVSDMVLQQLAAYRALGFRIVFVTMVPLLPAPALDRIVPLVARVVTRRNVGLDFGAWQDTLKLVNIAALTELLLVNDSICGPFLPLEPVFGRMRQEPAGLFGLTENLAPRPHLQSYLLLARGKEAIADIADFLARYRQTAYKRAVVRTGEVALSTWMRQRGHLVAACFGYEAVERMALASPRAQRRLTSLFPKLFANEPSEPGAEAIRRKLQHYPLNPAHSLWFELIDECGFPFLKTELLRRNPIGISDLSAWRSLVPASRRPLIEAHLRTTAAKP